jgi:hypothetical protein
MYLQDIQRVGVPELDYIDKTNLLKRLRYKQCLREESRNSLRCEYLGQLVWQCSEYKEQQQLQVGEVVLVGRNNKWRTDWPFGSMAAVFPGTDNCTCRKCEDFFRELTLPVQRVYLLEANSTTNSQYKSGMKLTVPPSLFRTLRLWLQAEEEEWIHSPALFCNLLTIFIQLGLHFDLIWDKIRRWEGDENFTTCNQE